MGKNSVRKTETVPAKQKNPVLFLVFRIILVIAFIFVVTCTIIYFMEMGSESRSFFSLHFALPTILLLVGIIAIMLSMMSKMSITGESKGDNMMIGVGFLLILCSIITLILSFLS